MNISNKLRQICLFCVFMDVLPVGFVYDIAAGGGRVLKTAKLKSKSYNNQH